MKALTLWQPWATLIATGAKRYETRSWQTSHRGLLAIHAAKTKQALDVCRTEPFLSVLLDSGIRYLSYLPFGAVVAVVELRHIYPAEAIRHKLNEQERAFGDYGSGRYAWQLEIVEAFEEPILARGAQGLWEWAPPDGIINV